MTENCSYEVQDIFDIFFNVLELQVPRYSWLMTSCVDHLHSEST